MASDGNSQNLLDTNSNKTDWNRCAICQENKKESLQCPADSKRQSDVGAGYKTLATNLVTFSDLGCLPVQIDLSRLDEGGKGIEETFRKNNARWHRSCYSFFNNTKVKRAEKRSMNVDNDNGAGGKYTRSCSTDSNNYSATCFICDGAGTRNKVLHQVSTLGLDSRVRECATALHDEKLLAKLSGGDLVALEAKYHAPCLAMLYKRERAVRYTDEEILQKPEGIVLAELVAYIEESRLRSTTELPVFKLADLASKYESRLKQLGCSVSTRINTTRLKERILSQIPDIEAYKQGRDVFFAFRKDLGLVLQKSHDACDEDAIHLSKAASIVRKDMLAMKYNFDGSFDRNCQAESVPASLVSLVNMILYGPNIETQASNSSKAQAGLTISQLLQYNSYLRRREGDVVRVRRNKNRETPVSLYIGMSIHAKTRSRDLIDIMHDLGLCVSYDRVLAISTDIGNAVCRRYQEEQVVCPPNLRRGLFTLAAFDNIDHNPSSTTAHDSFHGTGISLFQHATIESPGEAREPIAIEKAESNTKSVSALPESYTEVPPVDGKCDSVPIPESSVPLQSDKDVRALEEEESWLKNINNIVTTQQDSVGNVQLDASWAAYHSKKEDLANRSSSFVSALLPLLPDQAKSVAMIRHSMNVIKASIDFLNPGQVPVIAMDQPLFAVAKQLQWKWPDIYGEKKYVIMFGGLHIEMAFLKAIGGWLEDSGWTAALVEANVCSSGTAESFIKASSVTRSRRAHQIPANHLSTPLRKAYNKSQKIQNDEENILTFDDWCQRQMSTVPQFQFWYTAMQLELLLLVFMRSIRQAKFSLYVDTLSKMLPWFFALNHPNYARWLSVHFRDMRMLEQTSPDVATQFKDGGFFTIHKSSRHFSAIAIDQAHEQNNALVKGDGGAVGLTENPSALRRWMISGPEIARLVNEFEAHINVEANRQSPTQHHEVEASFQVSFTRHVNALVATLDEMGNPFMEESNDLLVLDTKDIARPAATARMCQIESLGIDQCNEFLTERLVRRTKSIYDPIKRNTLSFFNEPAHKVTKASQQISSLRSDCSLFARLFIACQTREGDLDDFFKHENQACPPSISDLGKLRLPRKKSELAECLQTSTTPKDEMPSNIDVVIIDGAAVVNMVKPGVAGAEKTFANYADYSFLPYVKAQLHHAKRVDVVWDDYIENSLKATTRCNRGAGVRRRVAGNNQLPRNWKEFLRVDANKRELFQFLAECLGSMEAGPGKQVITTHGEGVLCTSPCDTSMLAPCSHEEADTRMFLHVSHAVNQGFNNILLRTVDTDVLVLAVAVIQQISHLGQIELWIGFGTGKHLRFIAAHEIASTLGPRASKALPIFRAFTGCDTVSCFAGRSKRTALAVWNIYPEVTNAFLEMASPPSQISEECIGYLERFVVLMYDKTSEKIKVNDARKQLFSQKGRSLESIPPTRAALIEHTKRAAYQGGHCWSQALVTRPELPSPQDWGWTWTTDGWQPYWTTLPDVTKSSRELVRCGCTKGCKSRCSCVRANLTCTALCTCTGECVTTE